MNKSYPTELQDMNFDIEYYHQGYESAFRYVYDVLTDLKPASKSEKAFCQRFLNDLKREDIVLNLKIYNVVVAIANSLKHQKGVLGGKPIQLMPWQQFLMLNLFCWFYTSKAPAELAGSRRYTKVFAFIPRGNAKTQLAAIVSICGLVLTKNKTPKCSTSASSRKQASICFDEIKAQIKSSSVALKKRFKLRANDIQLTGGGSIFPTSSEADNLDGERIVVGILDELHAHKNRSVHDVIATSQSSSLDPILFMVTTAGNNTKSFCKEMYDYAKGLLFGEFENDQFLSIIYESDEEEINSELGLEQANPSLDHAVIRQTLRNKAQEALMSEAALAGFATKHLNRWYQYSESALVQQSLIDDAFKGPFPSDAELSQMKQYVGLDLAATSDLSSIVSLYVDTGGTMYARSRNYIPESTYHSLPSNYTSLYTEAINRQSLVLSGEIVTDLEQIKGDLNQIIKAHKPKEIGIDGAAGGLRFGVEFKSEYRKELTAVPQGFGLSSAAITFIRLLSTGMVKFDPNDVLLKWCIENARVREGQQGDIAVIKSANHNLKIDACIALLIALSLVPVVEKSTQIRTL
ncbi:terminase large subunit [Aeromonas hydrophila]|uniref:terminase large subunit n=1 Tax=Aeromonas hydrophila TaxID=644 RepID=UPI000F54810F|nr:terminase large subunit [Aeromonas hydrophila]RQM69731.1 terminase large subunit [Aeromonas hydrophila]